MKGVMSITGSPSPESSCSCCPVEHRHTCTCSDGEGSEREREMGGREGGEKENGRRGGRIEEGEERWEGAQCEDRGNIRKVVCVHASCARVCMLFHCYSSQFQQ